MDTLNAVATDMVIMTTDDYTIFNSLKANRAINRNHVRKLEKSLSEKQISVPIVVNDKLEVVDGQHRLAACENLGLPVYYIVVPGLDLLDVIRLNHDQRSWSLYDYVEAHASEGMDDYRTVLDWNGRYTMLNLTHILAILNDTVGFGGTQQIPVEQGKWKIKAEIEPAEEVASKINRTRDALRPFLRSSRRQFEALHILARTENGMLDEFCDLITLVSELEERSESVMKGAYKMHWLKNQIENNRTSDQVSKKIVQWIKQNRKFVDTLNGESVN